MFPLPFRPWPSGGAVGSRMSMTTPPGWYPDPNAARHRALVGRDRLGPRTPAGTGRSRPTGHRHGSRVPARGADAGPMHHGDGPRPRRHGGGRRRAESSSPSTAAGVVLVAAVVTGAVVCSATTGTRRSPQSAPTVSEPWRAPRNRPATKYAGHLAGRPLTPGTPRRPAQRHHPADPRRLGEADRTVERGAHHAHRQLIRLPTEVPPTSATDGTE